MLQYDMQHVKKEMSTRSRVCRIAFEALYGPFAWAYDWVSKTFFLGQWHLWQKAAIPHLKGKRVLEVGMGTGNMQVALMQAGFDTWGIDLSAQMLKQAKAKVRGHSLPVENMSRASASALPFPDDYFDAVLSTFPSEYISEPETLSEIARVLRPGGRLVIVPGGWLKPKGAQGRALEGIARIVYGSDSRPDEHSAEAIQHQLMENSRWYGWIGTLKVRMESAGFSVSGRVASNSKGSCLIIIGDQTSTRMSKPVDDAYSQSSPVTSVSR